MIRIADERPNVTGIENQPFSTYFLYIGTLDRDVAEHVSSSLHSVRMAGHEYNCAVEFDNVCHMHVMCIP